MNDAGSAAAGTPPSAADLLGPLRALIRFQQRLGIQEYRGTPELARLLGQGSQRPSPAATPTPPRPTPPGLSLVREEIEGCHRCPLHRHRQRIILGTGPADARLLIVGGVPGALEEEHGLPFQGEAGVLLDRMLAAIGFHRHQVYLSLLVKCRPRPASPLEAATAQACLPFLRQEIEAVAPAVICVMDEKAAQALLGSNKPLFQLRGRSYRFQGRLLIPTFAPAFLLANPELKRAAWMDLQMVRKHCSRC